MRLEHAITSRRASVADQGLRGPLWEVDGYDVTTAMDDPRVAGISLWQFMDIKADDGATKSCGSCVYAKPYNASTPMDCAIISAHCWRPGGENHKGLVDLWRRPKRVFASVQKLFMHDTH